MAKAKVTVKSRKSKFKSYLNSYNFAGIITGSIFVYIGFGPSLLPRAWYMQALISGVLFSLGYGLGVFISYIVREFEPKEPKLALRSQVKKITYGVLVIGYIAALILGYSWQKESHRLMEMDQDPGYAAIWMTILTIIVIMLLIWIARITRAFFRWLRRQIDKLLPIKIAHTLALVLTGFVIIGVVDGFLLNGVYNFINSAFSIRNDITDEGIERQNIPTASGSDESLISWDSLGKQGRKFIGQIATKEALQEYNNAPAMDPVRIYSGLESADTTRARAELAAADLKRAGGFNRDILVVVTTTGTGWVDENGVNPIEYMYNGDSAIVAMQYSYLPSWVSFLVDQQKAKDAGIALHNAVFKEWVKLPVSQRPKLVSFGESLGSFGSEAAFPAVSSFQATSQGALWVGPPNSNELWSKIVKARDEGSTEVLPVVDSGEVVRFAGRPGELSEPTAEWTNPRAVYLQHPSDPIIWWSPNLLFNKPAWYNEPRGFDVSPATRWFPIITFWQISADMAFANGVPDGHGHKYGTLPIEAWSYIAPPNGWTTEKAQALEAHFTQQ